MGQTKILMACCPSINPRGEDLSVFSQQELDDIALKLNTRTRKKLDWKCPAKHLLPEDIFDFKTYWTDKLNLAALGS
jgi:transposase, IS30 family